MGFGMVVAKVQCPAPVDQCMMLIMNRLLRNRSIWPSNGTTCPRSLLRTAGRRLVLAFLVIGLAGVASAGEGEPATKAPSRYTEVIRPFLVKHCFECHSGEKPKGKLSLDRLKPDFSSAAIGKQWQTISDQIASGEMPPEGKPRPPQESARAVSTWIDDQAKVAGAARSTDTGRVVLRRLNRTEYENTVCDLLGIKLDLKEMLPADTSADGFDNNAEALHVSSFLMERYLDAADAALNMAIANSPQPPVIKKRLSCKDERHVKHTTERVFRHLDDALVFFSSSPWQGVTLGQFYPPDRGTYRFRISAYGFQSADQPVTFRIDAGPMLMGSRNHLVGYFDAPPDRPGVIEFTDHFEARTTIRLLPYNLASAQAVHKVGADTYDGPGLAVEWVEVEGPLHDTWPPESHRRIFGDMSQTPAPVYNNRNRVEVASQNPAADAERILRRFTRRAFRRTVTDADLEPFIALFQSRLEEKYSFEQALRVALKGVLVSPDFLFLRESRPAKGGRLDDFAIASRLSYFLWSTIPDDELLALAEQASRLASNTDGGTAASEGTTPERKSAGHGAGTDVARNPPETLRDPAVMRKQVERMLSHPRAAAFTENFVGQWLGVRDIDQTEPDRRLYPEFDDLLKTAMVKETHLFFDELLKNDLSVVNFVTSDFSMLNERLAKHYGIAGVTGHQFRKVSLPAESHRGGVMTMAGVLKMSANGSVTSPVVRGAWVLDRILGTPPTPPPPGVAALEPDIRGATTIREQLAKHRQIESCASCHTQIDPPGFALESFDVIGGWREYYRSNGRGKPVTIDGRRMPYGEGPKVDPSDVLPDGRRFKNVDELKALLVEDKAQIARSMASKLVGYATGKAPDKPDHEAIEAIVARARDKNYGLRTLVHEVVQSELFQSK